MNRIYKIIWNKVSGCFVVVSELAQSAGKVRSQSGARLVPAAAAVLVTMSGSAFAVDGLRAGSIMATYDDQDIVTTADKDYGAQASGANGELTFNRGSLTTSGRGAYGAVASDGGTLTLNNTSVTTRGGGSSYGLYAVRNGTLNATGAQVNSGSDDAAVAMSQSHLTLNGGSVSGQRGLVAGGGATITASSVAVNSAGVGITANAATVDGRQLDITTSGDNAYGAYAINAGTLSLTDSDIHTSGAGAYGAYANGEGTTLTVSGGSISTTGSIGYGLVAGNKARVSADNLVINASGYGLYANNGTLVAKNLTVTTSDLNANDSVHAANGGQITLSDSQLNVSGNNAGGLVAKNSGSRVDSDNVNITLSNGAVGVQSLYSGINNASNVTLSGEQGGTGIDASASGAVNGNNVRVTLKNDDAQLTNSAIKMGGYSTSTNSVSLENSTLDVSGENAIGLHTTTGFDTLSLKNSVLDAHDGMGIYAEYNSGLTVNLDGSSLSAKTLLQSGSLNPPSAPISSVKINASNRSQLNGNVNVDQTLTTDSAIALESGSVWNGTSNGLHQLTLSGDSQWNVTDSGDVGSVTLDNSTLNMTAEGTGYSKLTLGSLSSNNGTVDFKTHLMGDDSQTDQLHVTGDYSGDTAVVVKNAGGTGAKTLQGIKLIQVDGNVDGTFTQKGRIVAGAYDYFLKRGTAVDSGKWYLDSEASAVPVIKPIKPVNPVNPVDPVKPVDPRGADATPVTRPEAGSYAANLAAANTLFTTSQDDRLGETRYIDAQTGEEHSTSLWLRNEGGHSRSKDSSGQLKTTGNRYVMQLGGDVGQWTRNGDDRFNLGVMGGYASAQSNTHSNVTGYGSKGDIHGYSAGVYGGWQQDNVAKTGAYLDSWALYNWFDNSVKGDDIGEESYKSKGFTASLEGGYTFKVGEMNARQSYYLQPKAQVTWMGVKADDHREGNGTRVTGSGDNNVQTRLGLRAFMKGHSLVDEGKGRTFEPFVEANWIHNTDSFGSTLNGVNISQAGGRDIGELKVGVDAKVSNRVNLWGNIGQQLGDKGYSDSSASIGMKVNF